MDSQEKIIFGSIVVSFTLLIIGVWEYVVRPIITFAVEIINIY
ncbi:MAG: hypothetical protein NUV82_01570 [Candidatus Komeilibacteria bacterium]|nr:hypothetical protein [Candidatus Komeilibacteria bacterium]